tara:strand:+ start:2786 stop:3454 length:669 start_codon:yes stop_codon:yes gene_type:complete
MNNIFDLLSSQEFVQQPLSSIILHLILCMVLVSIVSWYYKKFSQSLGGKTHIGSILPLIGLTVFFVILVVKSSLALSLGLVGALSIVRFRTPIKEPEELGYLFLIIAVGLGFGAGYSLVTIAVTLSILLYLYFTREKINSKLKGEYSLLINVLNSEYNKCLETIKKNTVAFKVVRMESADDRVNIYFNITIDNKFDLQDLIKNLKLLDNESKIDFVEAGVNW